MSKILALAGLVISVLIGIFMITDLAWTRASLTMDIGFLIGAAILGVMSFFAYRQAG
jgi:hypothetical protein